MSIKPEQPRAVPAKPSGGDDHVTAVKRLFQEHNRTLVSFLNARLHSEQEARDIAQEAYVRVLQLDNHGAVSFLRSYLFRVAANLAVDRLRERAVRETPEPQALFDSLVEERVPDRTVLAGQQLEAVRAALLALPAHIRRAFIWHVFGGQSTVQIAAKLKLTDRMVRLYIAQGLAACRARIDA